MLLLYRGELDHRFRRLRLAPTKIDRSSVVIIFRQQLEPNTFEFKSQLHPTEHSTSRSILIKIDQSSIRKNFQSEKFFGGDRKLILSDLIRKLQISIGHRKLILLDLIRKFQIPIGRATKHSYFFSS